MIPTSSTVSELLRAPIPDAPVGKYPVRILVCGIPEGVNQVVYRLHLLGFAEVGAWSPPLPSPISGEVIRIMTQYFRA
jgi:hypothetical protein